MPLYKRMLVCALYKLLTFVSCVRTLTYLYMCGGVRACLCAHMLVHRKGNANALQKVDGDGSESFANSNFIYLFSFPATK